MNFVLKEILNQKTGKQRVINVHLVPMLTTLASKIASHARTVQIVAKEVTHVLFVVMAFT